MTTVCSVAYVWSLFVIKLRRRSLTFIGLNKTVKVSYIIYISPCEIQSLGVIPVVFLLYLLNVLDTHWKRCIYNVQIRLNYCRRYKLFKIFESQ